MKYEGFIGGSYTGESSAAASDRSINLFPERNAGAGAPENQLQLLGTPGLSMFATLPGGSVPALYAEPLTGRLFAVSASLLYEVLATGAANLIGNVGAGPYSFASAASGEMMISAAGGAASLLNLTSNTLTALAIGQFLGSAQCEMIDDYFISLVPGSREFQISNLLDGSTWNALDFGAAEGGPDNIIAFRSSHRELWLFSERRIEIYIDDGAANFPFARLNGAFLETGCAAAGSIARLDNTLFWLGQDERGAGIVWRANGYTPQRISTHSVEWFIREYARAGGIADAVAYAYQSFYVLHFPSATVAPSSSGGVVAGVTKGATWVYDVATGLWHERAYFSNGLYSAHLARSHAYCFNKHLVGDWQSGAIYEMSTNLYDDAGQEIKRVRRAPHLVSEHRTLFYHELEIEMQVGAGNAADPNPEAMLRYSNDGGMTWGNELTASMGAAGNYQTRVRWQMLGKGRRRVFEFSTTARVPVCLVDAYLRVTEGTS